MTEPEEQTCTAYIPYYIYACARTCREREKEFYKKNLNNLHDSIFIITFAQEIKNKHVSPKKNKAMKKRTIWSNRYDATREEDWKEDFEDWCEANGLDKEEEDIDDYINETLSIYLQDERANLNKEVKGVIVAFAKLGLWDGTHNGAAIIGVNVKDILHSECDYCDWYCDDYNVRCDASHHDGTNHYLYRVAKDSETAHRLVNKIAYEGMTEEQFRKATRSLLPHVAKVYGWKVKWMKKK